MAGQGRTLSRGELPRRLPQRQIAGPGDQPAPAAWLDVQAPSAGWPIGQAIARPMPPRRPAPVRPTARSTVATDCPGAPRPPASNVADRSIAECPNRPPPPAAPPRPAVARSGRPPGCAAAAMPAPANGRRPQRRGRLPSWLGGTGPGRAAQARPTGGTGSDLARAASAAMRARLPPPPGLPGGGVTARDRTAPGRASRSLPGACASECR
jgi:hypothetical protein